MEGLPGPDLVSPCAWAFDEQFSVKPGQDPSRAMEYFAEADMADALWRMHQEFLWAQAAAQDAPDESPQVPVPTEHSIYRPYASFGATLMHDYPDLVPEELPIGEIREALADYTPLDNSDDHYGLTSTDPDVRFKMWCEYRDTFRTIDKQTLYAGMPPELLTNSIIDLTCCREFLVCMRSLQYAQSEELHAATTTDLHRQLGTTSAEETEQVLVQTLTAAKWGRKPLKPNDFYLRGITVPTIEGYEDSVKGSYRQFIRRLVKGELDDGVQDRAIRAYPLERMNPDTWLYLCEDGLLRAKVGDNIAIAPPDSRRMTNGGYDLGTTMVPVPENTGGGAFASSMLKR